MRSYTWAYATLEMLGVLGYSIATRAVQVRASVLSTSTRKLKNKNKTAKCSKCNALQLEAARHRTNRSRSRLYTKLITEACWTNSAVRHSLDFALNKVLFKISVALTDMYEVPDAVSPIHAVSSHVATDKDPSKFRSIFSDNLQPIATRGKIARGTLLVDIGCSSERAPTSVSYYNEN